LVQAAWGGIVFGIVAWRTRSFLPAFAAHWAIAVTMDWLCYQHLAR
jgi:membrane protease YdiL (CAAX protease family)